LAHVLTVNDTLVKLTLARTCRRLCVRLRVCVLKPSVCPHGGDAWLWCVLCTAGSRVDNTSPAKAAFGGGWLRVLCGCCGPSGNRLLPAVAVAVAAPGAAPASGPRAGFVCVWVCVCDTDRSYRKAFFAVVVAFPRRACLRHGCAVGALRDNFSVRVVGCDMPEPGSAFVDRNRRAHVVSGGWG
jgi:hypothetical protein